MVSHPLQIVQNDAGLHDDSDCLGVVLHRSEEDLPTLRQDAEGLLNDSALPRQSAIEDYLLLRQLALCIRLHEVCAKSKRIVTKDVVRRWPVIIW